MAAVTMTPLETPPGFIADDTVFDAPGTWRDGHLIRFWRGSWQTYGGWERLMLGQLGGVCRAVFNWSDTSITGAPLTVGFGTHRTLELWQGGLLYDITPAAGFTAGQIDGTGGAGYGAGAFGLGTYSQPALTDYFPLTWSLGAFGSWLIANPRNQGIFAWQNNVAVKAALLANAPAKVTYALSLPQRQIMALGCNEEVSGTFNPLCIRWSDIEAPTVWNTLSSNNAGEYVLEGGGRIVTGRVVGDYVFVWTDIALYLGTFVGSPDQTWSFNKLGENCGAISPGAPIVSGQNVMWISPDRVFWSCSLGGAPQQVASPIRDEFAVNLALGQADKIIGATTSTYGELCWFYPDGRDGLECSRDVRLNSDGWCRGRLARTAYVDASPSNYPIGVDPAGSVYWHEKGASADGAALTGWIEGNAFFLDQAQGGVRVEGVWPDFKDQVGQLALTLYMRNRPQGVERVKGPWTLAPGVEKRSFRAEGRIARIRFDFSSSPAYARAGAPMFDVLAVGGR
jgi:hypothetical protein